MEYVNLRVIWPEYVSVYTYGKERKYGCGWYGFDECSVPFESQTEWETQSREMWKIFVK